MCIMFKKPKRIQISIIVPFRKDRKQPQRIANWKWLKKYVASHMPDAEIVVGKSKGKIFSKSEAVNNGVKKSKGRILVILDADCYIDTDYIQYCADEIDKAMGQGKRLWFIPYRQLYRLTNYASNLVLNSNPRNPRRFSSPPPVKYVESTIGSMHGKRYGAMIQIYPREAFNLVGGMDERFRGWGGEDIAHARKLDTLYVKHKTTPNDVLHLWHPKIGGSFKTRKWAGQTTNEPNGHLASRYSHATGDRALMRKLMWESLDYVQENKWHHKLIAKVDNMLNLKRPPKVTK